MSTTPTVVAPEQEENLLQRVKSAFGTGVFVLLQRSPKFLKLYRNERSWTLFRIVLGCFGAALVVLPLSLWHGYFTAVFGLFVFVLSILLPPAELESPTDRKARELGAKTVVSGGEYRPTQGSATAVQLFMSPTNIWALDRHQQPVVAMTTKEISELDVVQRKDDWILILRCGDRRAEFLYSGIFAERFARLAEESLRHAWLGGQPLPLKSRSARV
jgi:hypothetical protein